LYYPGLLDDLKADVQKRLDAEITTIAGDVKIERFVTAGSPHREIIRVAAERQAELIVLGAFSHGVIDHMFFGSTTNHVVRRARCPVLTVKT